MLYKELQKIFCHTIKCNYVSLNVGMELHAKEMDNMG